MRAQNLPGCNNSLIFKRICIIKKTDLEKNKALKLMGDLRATATSQRFGSASKAPPDRREQRKMDQATGSVSFPIKLRQPSWTPCEYGRPKRASRSTLC